MSNRVEDESGCGEKGCSGEERVALCDGGNGEDIAGRRLLLLLLLTLHVGEGIDVSSN